MVSFFFIDAYTPVIHRTGKEHRCLIATRAIAATIGVIFLIGALISWSIEISTKQINISTSNEASLLPTDTTGDSTNAYAVFPNARICLIGDEDNLVARNISFTISCSIVGFNNTNTNKDCGGVTTPLRGWSTKDGDYNITWAHSNDRFYYPYWRTGYCFHYSTINVITNDVSYTMEFDMFANPPLNGTQSFYDITFLDPRNDPMVLLYNITAETRTNPDIETFETFVKRFVDNDQNQQPNEYFLNEFAGLSIQYAPHWYQAIRNTVWNFLGIFSLTDQYWTLMTSSQPGTVSSGAEATVQISLDSSVAQGLVVPVTSVESRAYTVSAMFAYLYALYFAISNGVYHFFGQPGTANPFGYCRVFVSQDKAKKHIKENFGNGDTLPFNNLPDNAGKARNFGHHDFDTLCRRVLNLEAVLAEYYIDVNHFRTLSKEKDEPHSLTMTEKIEEFGKEVWSGEQDNIKAIEQNGPGWVKTGVADLESGLKQD